MSLSTEARLSKMIQSISGSKQGKSVLVLLSTDVRERDGEVYLPTLSEQSALRKEEKGQFNKNVLFTWNMTEEDVKKEILSHFTYLKDQSFCCASAVNGHRKLNFHGKREVWTGALIKRNIKGNSALYILTEMTDVDLSKVLQEPTGELSSHSAGAVSCVVKEHSTSSQIPTSFQISTSSQIPNQKSVTITRKNDQGVQQGLLMVPPVVSPPVKCKKGNNGYAINLAILQNQLTKVTTAAPALVQLLPFPATQTSMQRTVIPGQLAFPRLAHLQQNQPPEGSVQGQYQIEVPQGIPPPATAGSSQQVLVQRAGGDPLKMPSGELSVQWQQNQPPEGSLQGQYQIVVPQDIPSPATAGSSQQVLVQRAGGDPLRMPSGELSVQWQQNQPPEGPLQGQYQIVVPLGIPSPATAGSSQQVLEQRAGEDPLKILPGELSVQWQQNQPPESSVQGQYQIGVPQGIPSPATAGSSQQVLVQREEGDPFKMPLRELSVQGQTDSGCESSKENCTNNKMCECEESSVHPSDIMIPDWAYTKQEKMFIVTFKSELPTGVTAYQADFKGLKAVNLTLQNPYTLTGFYPRSEVGREVTVKIIKFTENVGYERFGKVFTFTYKDETSELAKKVLASETTRNAVLESVCKALQGVSAGSDNLNAFRPPEAGNDDVQTPIYPKNDENQRDYDADDKASNLSSPFSEITDPGCEDEGHDTTDISGAGGGHQPLGEPVIGGGEQPPLEPAEGGGERPLMEPVEGGGERPLMEPVGGGGERPLMEWPLRVPVQEVGEGRGISQGVFELLRERTLIYISSVTDCGTEAL